MIKNFLFLILVVGALAQEPLEIQKAYLARDSTQAAPL